MLRRRKTWTLKQSLEGWQFWPPGYDADFVSLRGKFTRQQAREILAVVEAVYERGSSDRQEKIQHALGLHGARRSPNRSPEW